MKNRTAGMALLSAIAALLGACLVLPANAASQTAQTAPTAQAVPPAQAGQPVDAATAARLRSVLPNAAGAEVRTTPMNGVYELSRNTELVYVTADGKFGIIGDLYRIGDSTNLTEPRRRELRVALLSAVPDADSILFAAPAPKYTVTVFTDVDCQYCRHLHSEIDQYNQLGISVRYLFYPRTGPNTESWYKAEQVWCSADRKTALTQAKLGQPLAAQRCPNNPVARDYALGGKLGVEGTPYIFTDTGVMYEGLVEPAQLYAALQKEHGYSARAPEAARSPDAAPTNSAAGR